MISNQHRPTALFVWIYLPGKVYPVVAGKIRQIHDKLIFNYGRSYLDREDAISLFTPELPLVSGNIAPLGDLLFPGCIRDGAPDAWGRRVIINEQYGYTGQNINQIELDELSYMLCSGSDRIGALDFQLTPDRYIPRNQNNATLDELIHAVDMIQSNIPLSPELAKVIQYGTSIGGARPKVLIDAEDSKFIAKFSTSRDLHNFVKGEYIAMRLAALSGLNVADVKLVKVGDRDVLLVERFDREKVDDGWARISIVSALTVLQLSEDLARYASYEELANKMRALFVNPKQDMEELFSRLTFNILCGNTDDHARNHAAIWDGNLLSLTKAYDICPQSRIGREASQGMCIANNERSSQLSVCIRYCELFDLSRHEAADIVIHQIRTIAENWDTICKEAKLSDIDRNLFWGNQFLNPFSYEDLPDNSAIKHECRRALEKGRTSDTMGCSLINNADLHF